MESVRSVSKLSTESVGSCRELVANNVHTADADATKLDSLVASATAVCIGLNIACSVFTRDSIYAIARTHVYATPIPSVCPSQACIVSKRLNVSSKFFHHGIS